MNLNPNEREQIKPERINPLERLGSALRNKPEILPVAEVYEIQELLNSINNTKKEWINAINNFEYAETQDLIDYYIYKIKACEVMYAYLLKIAKEKGIRVEHVSKVQAVSL